MCHIIKKKKGDENKEDYTKTFKQKVLGSINSFYGCCCCFLKADSNTVTKITALISVVADMAIYILAESSVDTARETNIVNIIKNESEEINNG